MHQGHRVVGLKCQGRRIVEVRVRQEVQRQALTVPADYVFSTMPVPELLASMNDAVPSAVRRISEGLVHRDFVTVGLLLNRLKIRNETAIRTIDNRIPDNWIYIQEPEVKLGRLQIFNNWSPYMVKDPCTVWLGLEYLLQSGRFPVVKIG